MNNLTDQQLSAIRYYEGDVTGNDPFWGDGKRYVTINSLFYPGIATETSRTKEGKRLNPAIIDDVGRLLDFSKNLLSAFDCVEKKNRTTYRVERYSDYQLTKQAGRTVSFTSTSTSGFLKYYTDRVGIALMVFQLDENSIQMCFDEILKGDYYKADEAEVLLPPNMPLEIEEIELDETDKEIKDSLGNGPIVKALVKTKKVDKAEKMDLGIDLYDRNYIEAGKRVMDCLNNHKDLAQKDIEMYVGWKKAFVAELF